MGRALSMPSRTSPCPSPRCSRRRPQFETGCQHPTPDLLGVLAPASRVVRDVEPALDNVGSGNAISNYAGTENGFGVTWPAHDHVDALTYSRGGETELLEGSAGDVLQIEMERGSMGEAKAEFLARGEEAKTCARFPAPQGSSLSVAGRS